MHDALLAFPKQKAQHIKQMYPDIARQSAAFALIALPREKIPLPARANIAQIHLKNMCGIGAKARIYAIF